MKKKAIMILAEGFEEVEAASPADILRRADIDLTIAGIGSLHITGAHGLAFSTDLLLKDTDSDYDAIILPGGGGGARNLAASQSVLERWGLPACNTASHPGVFRETIGESLSRERSDGGSSPPAGRDPITGHEAPLQFPTHGFLFGVVAHRPSGFLECDHIHKCVRFLPSSQAIAALYELSRF